MPLHIIKLSVGTETPEGLREWQTYFQATYGKLFHTTRMTPKRKAEILDGGSIYWVFKGAIRCRQRIIDLEDFVNEEGTKYCRIVLDPELIETRPYPHRAFQGWRYLDRKSTRLNSSHITISYAVFCLKKKKQKK